LRSEPRPKLVTLLAVGVLIFAMLQFARFVLGLALPDLPLSVPKWYIPLTGAVWGMGGLAVGAGLFAGRAWAPAAARASALAFTAWYWSDRLLFAQSDYVVQLRPLSIVVNLMCLGFLFFSLGRRDTIRYFGEIAHE
jgi:hypothetical protein